MDSLPLKYDRAELDALATSLKSWARELGFDALGIGGVDLGDAESGLSDWLAAGFHGAMNYMAKHGMKRARPAELVPGTVRVISVRMAYLPAATLRGAADWRGAELAQLGDPAAAVVSVYARGRDYHKVLRQRLQQLAERLLDQVGPFGYRVFTDSAPVMEVELARQAGLGWRGKHTLLLQRDAGSFFFLGEIFIDLPLPIDAASQPGVPADDGATCGTCTRCIDACPTGAIVAPYRLDARRCISYLTIELKGSIPEPLRELIGNRVYGCDDCQLVCPWNKYAVAASLDDFDARNGLDSATLVALFSWDASAFDTRLAGSAIRRIGHEQWLRNIAVGLGNALRAVPPPTPALRAGFEAALRARADHPSALVREHVEWALQARASA